MQEGEAPPYLKPHAHGGEGGGGGGGATGRRRLTLLVVVVVVVVVEASIASGLARRARWLLTGGPAHCKGSGCPCRGAEHHYLGGQTAWAAESKNARANSCWLPFHPPTVRHRDKRWVVAAVGGAALARSRPESRFPSRPSPAACA